MKRGPRDRLGKLVVIAQALSILGQLLLGLWGRVLLSQMVWPLSVCLVVVVGEGVCVCLILHDAHLNNDALPGSSRDFLSLELDTWGSPMLVEWMDKRQDAAANLWTTELLQAKRNLKLHSYVILIQANEYQ